MRHKRPHSRAAHALLQDHSLVVEWQPECEPLVRSWLPLTAKPATTATPLPQAALRVDLWHSSLRPAPLETVTMRLGPVTVHVDDDSSTVAMSGAAGCCGRLDLEALEGTLWADPDGTDQTRIGVYAMLTIGSALLLGRLRRALIHAGAVVPPGHQGWLVVGDAHSGKSTTCASLATAGCALLSDDQVVLSLSAGHVNADGWLRHLHLDEGWSEGVPTGRRRTVHPSELGGTRSPPATELGMAVFTSVRPDEPTTVSDISAADAFLQIVRQSPWLFADRNAAASIMDTLSAVATLPCYSLRLGLDSFGGSDRLLEVLHPLLS